MWLMMAVLSACFAGLTSILAKCGIRKTDSDVATAIRTVVVLLFSWSFDRNDQRKILSVPDPVGTCNGSFMDLLF